MGQSWDVRDGFIVPSGAQFVDYPNVSHKSFPPGPSQGSSVASPGIFLEAREVGRIIGDLSGDQVTRGKRLKTLDPIYFAPPLHEYLRILKVAATFVSTWVDFSIVYPPGPIGALLRPVDCDDVAFVAKSVFVRAAYKDGLRRPSYCFGWVWAKEDRLKEVYEHAFNWFIDDERRLWFVDVQPKGFCYWQGFKVWPEYEMLLV
ncbi:hypothetical protein [Niveibacterium microcysteis]|uniref:Uncharacterized protein n=1 Tax=Niveibacterium microcysteis TaxID=2811415 RepID=A0ABX7M429_9RHOO|nr:hypothetical protein [Niveibacterium microcysteis]QSI76507.1 hypothetical protein JY500_18925 [Niveibacterium microcysteis]